MEIFVLYVSLVMAVAPMLAMLFFIWWVDRYDREPLRYVIGAFAWGGFGAIAFSILGTELGIGLFGDLSAEAEDRVVTLFIAPVVEELMKGIVVIYLLRKTHFDNVTDGLVYGAAAGLGFGMTENFLYFTQYAEQYMGVDWINLLFVRSMFTANMHCAATATFGAGISMLKDNRARGKYYALGGYLMAVLLHCLWNYLVTVPVFGNKNGGFATLLLSLYIVIIFFIFILGIRKERLQRQLYLEDEFEKGVLPEEYNKMLLSYREMRKTGWFPEYLDKNRYLHLVSRLALRKASYRGASEKRKEELKEEINGIRAKLSEFNELIDSKKSTT